MGCGVGVVVPLAVHLDVVSVCGASLCRTRLVSLPAGGIVRLWWTPSRMRVAAAGGCTASGSVGVAVNVVVDLSGVSLCHTSLLSLPAGNVVRLWWAPSRMGAAAAGGCPASGSVGVSVKVVVDLFGVSL